MKIAVAAGGAPIPSERIEGAILFIRGRRVMLDADLARLYGVPTKALNQAVKRNRSRFPADFAFRLTSSEKEKVVTDCDHLKRLRFTRAVPQAFTEHGALMLANVLNSDTAVRVSIEIVRTFVKLREAFLSHHDLARRLGELEGKYDSQFRAVFEAIRQLMATPEPKRRQIGFRVPGG